MKNSQSGLNFKILVSPTGVTLCIVIGIIAICVSAYMHMMASAQSSWPGTYAKVTEGAVIHFGRTPYRYNIRMKYKYKVDGRDYSGECEMHTQNNLSVAEANELLANYYPDGRALEVYYDPKDPKNSTATIKDTRIKATQIGLGGILFLISAFVVNFFVKRSKLHA